ncbi:MAG: lipid-A-disaccharide synthase N-terminal domain-containing protein [Geminicoccaceae bacterium]
METEILIWLIIGFAGQFLFSMRFFVQWVASEKAGRSVIPVAFWYFSIAGGLTLLAYAIHREDPVFIAGQALGILIYLRNLRLIFKEARVNRAANEAKEP